MNARARLSGYNDTYDFRRSRLGHRELDFTHKFMQTVGDEMFTMLEKFAEEKGIRVQTLLRAVIIPEWMKRQKPSTGHRLIR
jgi:hypothetical protein